MKLLSYEKKDDCLILKTSNGMMGLFPVLRNVVHILYTLEENFSKKKSLCVIEGKSKEEGYKLRDCPDRLIFLTGDLKIEINKETCAFSYYDRRGGLIAKEPCRGGKTLEPFDISKIVFDENAQIKVDKSVDGMRASAVDYNRVFDRRAVHTKLEFEFAKDEALYGFGSHEEGTMNLRGSMQYLYQQNLKSVVPFFLSTMGYGVLIDSCSMMTFRDDAYGSSVWTDADDEMDYYFIYGPEFDDIIKLYRGLTGIAPLFPKWFFGYIQSKERYKTQKELIDVAREYRERGIPLDALVLDWQSWPEGQWGQKTFDKERFPDPELMMRTLHDMHVKLMISVWPNMHTGCDNQIEMKKEHFLLGDQSTYDAFNESARKLYWKQARDGLFKNGIDAWWCDSSEPFEDDWKGEIKPEPEQRFFANTQRTKLYIDPEYLSAYSLMHSKGIYEGQREETDKKRVVNLTRSSYAGQHRYATVTWSGDVFASFETLKKSIPAGLNFCAAGEPYWTIDIGAFFVKKKEQWFWSGLYENGCEDPGYRELYLRWFQYAAFLPMLRSHGTDTPREVWRFGEKGTPFYDTLVKFIKLRYRLLPYIYSLAAMVTFEGYTMLRSLAFDFRNDKNTYNICDQYMFGPAFMVNPVTNAMYYGPGGKELSGVEKTRRVYLPSGLWYDFWTGKRLDGKTDVTADAGLETMPLFVRAGSIVPMGPETSYADEGNGKPLELRIYGGANGRFVFYDDEGDNYNYEHGLFAKTLIHWDDDCGELSLERTGQFSGMCEKRMVRVVLVSGGHGAGVSECVEYDAQVEFDGCKTSVKIPAASYEDS